MAKGQEETFTSQVERKKGTPPGIAHYKQPSHCYVYKGVEILLSVPTDISLELSDGATVSTVGGADNAVYFTRE